MFSKREAHATVIDIFINKRYSTSHQKCTCNLSSQTYMLDGAKFTKTSVMYTLTALKHCNCMVQCLWLWDFAMRSERGSYLENYTKIKEYKIIRQTAITINANSVVANNLSLITLT